MQQRFHKISPVALTLILFLTALPGIAQQTSTDASPSAWEALQSSRPGVADEVSAAEREVLEALTEEQMERYLGGTPSSQILLSTGESLADFAARKNVAGFEITWYSIDGGGGMRSTGGDFELSGTIGQPDAGRMSGGDFTLTGGFWAITRSLEIFSNGFEGGNTSAWSQTI